MSQSIKYQTRPLKSWDRVKEFRQRYYKNYANAHNEGRLRWVGGAVTFDALPAGLGDDLSFLSSEGYGASIGNDPAFSVQCQDALEAQGFARDLCSYLRNYWGSMFLNKYYFGGEFPKPDFALQSHLCCMHAKWYQLVGEHEQIPHFSIDAAMSLSSEIADHSQRVDYVAEQCLDAIDWMQKVTGRPYDDEKLIAAVMQEAKNTSLWAQICSLNKATPAPVDEKSLYALYVLLVLNKSNKEVGEIYEEVLEDIQDRIAQHIAAVPNERFRIMHDGQPPWSFLKLFRYLEQYGVVSVGSYYTYCLMGAWDFIDGHMVPAKVPTVVPKNREEAVRMYAEWYLTKKPIVNLFNHAQPKIDAMLSMIKDWNVQAMIMHFNRGCEGISLHVAESKLAVSKAGIPILAYEGNMADDREFDEVSTLKKVDAFLESLSLEKIV
jgi:benzoyl-CoA reductase subunit B